MTSTALTSFGAHVPEDKTQYLVQTPYGPAMVIRTRRRHHRVEMREFELTSWHNSVDVAASGSKGPRRPALLYSPVTYPSIPPTVDCEVMTLFGRGRVTELRTAPVDMVVVQLTQWRLARRGRVTCVLRPESVQVVRPNKLYEKDVYERVEYATQCKDQASSAFAMKQYADALQQYSRAIDAVQRVQHTVESDNYVRADLLLIMVTCSNNAAMCCKQLRDWSACIQYARTAETILDALYKQRGKRIHKILNEDGYADSKMFGEWKVKSLLNAARAYLERHEVEQALELLKTARTVITEYTVTDQDASMTTSQRSSQQALLSCDKEVKRLFTTCKEQRKADLKKEKQRAKAMFGSTAVGKESRSMEESEEKKDFMEGDQPILPSKRTVSFSDTVQEKVYQRDDNISNDTDDDSSDRKTNELINNASQKQVSADALSMGAYFTGMIGICMIGVGLFCRPR